jgi:hypothetical protein
MASRVFVHIGTMKSATTYIQELFDHNCDVVLDQGLLWTRSGDNFLAVDDLLGNTARPRPGLEGAWKLMDDRIRAHHGDALISNELLAPVIPKKRAALIEALEPAEVQIVITARDLGRVVPSQWQTSVRNRATRPWREYLDALLEAGADHEANPVAAGFWRRQDIASIIDKWRQHVPLGQITLVTVPSTREQPTLLAERFTSVVGIDAARLTAAPTSNQSIGAHSAELLRRLNERTGHFDWLSYRWAYKNALSRMTLAERAREEPPVALSRDELAWARSEAEAMVTAVAASGVRVVGELADLIPVAAPPDDVVDPGMATDGELLAAATEGLVGMGAILGDTRIELDALVRLVEAGLPAGPEVDAAYLAFGRAEAELDPAPNPYLRRARFVRDRLTKIADIRPETEGPGGVR